jgi:NADP-dependent 3-hydroxy acid dehydrogenase YdfG
MNIKDKVVLITGASAGIGLATARLFAAAGAKVAIAARSVEKLNQLADELRSQGEAVLVVPTDMTHKAEVDRMVGTTIRHYGQIDILINNAGQAASGTVADVNPDHYRQIIELNLFGPLHAMQAVVPTMRQHSGGPILNVSSMVSKMRIPGLGTYAFTKAALNVLSDTARVELAPDNIRVITIYPRMTATGFGRNSLGNQQMRQQQRSAAPRADMVIDSAEYVAGKILLAARQEPAEQFMEALGFDGRSLIPATSSG